MRVRTLVEILFLLLLLSFAAIFFIYQFQEISISPAAFFFEDHSSLTMQPSPDLADYCDSENMAYNISFPGDALQPAFFVKGKKFDCVHLSLLMRFNLSDKNHRIEQRQRKAILDPRFSASNGMAFVFAADHTFYPSLRAMIDGVRRQFQPKTRIIVYDLGGLSTQKQSKTELDSICNLELRVFNFTMLPSALHRLKAFAWKALILAEMFAEFDSFIYFDTSIHFNTNDYGPFFRGINAGLLSDVQFTLGTHHGLKFATHPDMFTFIPLDPRLDKAKEDDVEMMEANMIIVHRSEFSRQMLKWSLLCALTPECIEPKGARILCQHYDADQLAEDGQCHRQDQSVLNILLHNMELQLQNSGSKITPHLRYNHPRNWATRHQLQRGQITLVDIANAYKCQ